MSRYGHWVTLEGTWVRENTKPYEITDIRDLTRKMNRECFAETDDKSRVYFTAQHSASGWEGRDTQQTRFGTFTACLFVPGMGYIYEGTARSVKLEARAKMLLKWLVQDITCRPPKLKVTNVTWERRPVLVDGPR